MTSLTTINPINFIPLIVFLIMLIGIKIKLKGFHEDFLSRDNLKIMQGIASIGIVLHHLVQLATTYGQFNKGPITNFNNFGFLFTGIFFFGSGFGLVKSALDKKGYLDNFLTNRIPAVLIPFILCNNIYSLYDILVRHEMTTTSDKILIFTGLKLINNNMWFMIEIMILYLVFFVTFKFIKKRKLAILLVSLFVFALIYVTFRRGHDLNPLNVAWFKGEWWFNSIIAFPIGMIFAQCESNIVKLLKKIYYPLLAVALVGLWYIYPFSNKIMGEYGYYKEWPGYQGFKEKFYSFLAQEALLLVFMIVLILLSMKIKVGNKVLSWLGKVSLSLFLIHELFKRIYVDLDIKLFAPMKSGILRKPWIDDIALFGFVLILSLLATPLIHFVITKCVSITRKLINKTNK